MSTLLGLDLGTSSFKVSAFRETGEHLTTMSRPTPWLSTSSGAELDPAEFTDVVRSLLQDCAEAVGGGVAGVGVTGMAETMFIETSDGAVHAARAWNERRSPAIHPDPELFGRTGLLDPSRTPAVELRRVADEGGAVRRWSGMPEYAVEVLGGSRVAERSLAARSGLVDVRSGDWDPDLLAWAGIANVDVPVPSGGGQSAGTATIGGPIGRTVLAVAGHDHLVAALGADAADEMTVFDSLGTGEAIITSVREKSAGLAMEDVARFTAAGFNVGAGVDQQDVIALAGLGTGNRFNLLLAALESNGFRRADVLLPEARPTGDPEVVGAGLPADLTELVAVLSGADWQSLRAGAAETIGRAVPDIATASVLWWSAVAASTRNAATALDALGRLAPRATRRVAAGGWLGNPGIRAVRDHILGPFRIPVLGQSGTRGAALQAGLAAGVYGSRADFPAPIGEGVRV